MKNGILVLCVLSTIVASAQKVDVKKIEIAGENIIVHYDLDDGNPNNEYQISLFSSQNSFAKALTKVSGDVGPEVKIGTAKRIIWNAKEELGLYKGRIALEVRGKVFTPVAKLNNITVSSKFKRGKAHPITWKPGNNNAVHIELLKDGQRVTGELNQPNNGSFSLFIPQHASVGKGYSLRITDSRNPEDVVNSQPFSVKRKVPMLFKILPVIAVGGVVAALAGGGGGGTPEPPASTEIPSPDFPGGN
jgi:hypothetical protein